MVARSSVVLAAATVVVAVVLSSAASWGVASLASDHVARSGSPVAEGNTGATGKSGAVGATGDIGPTGDSGQTGATGAAGKNGASTAVGAAGATGATGPQGPAGDIGPAGPPGATGASGASAPSFSATSPSGLAYETFPRTYSFETQTRPVPAGPALVGFSVGLSSFDFNLDTSATCSLIDAASPTTVLATTGWFADPLPPYDMTFAATQVVSLSQATILTVECTSQIPNRLPFIEYRSLSIYAISFATP